MFTASKILWAVFSPGGLAILLPALACLLLWLGRRRTGLALLTLGVVGVLIVTVLPVGAWLLRPLEDRFPQPALPVQVDGIVVLGGSVDLPLTVGRGQPALNGGAERLTVAVALARRYPDARLVYTGGVGTLAAQPTTEAAVARQVLADLGLGARLEIEDASRNTHENAVETYALVRPAPGDVWLLVTSAAHMPRAVGSFRGAGWQVTPVPVDYLTLPAENFRLAWGLGGLGLVEAAAHEWLGLVVYRFLGRTRALFPGPA